MDDAAPPGPARYVATTRPVYADTAYPDAPIVRCEHSRGCQCITQRDAAAIRRENEDERASVARLTHAVERARIARPGERVGDTLLRLIAQAALAAGVA